MKNKLKGMIFTAIIVMTVFANDYTHAETITQSDLESNVAVVGTCANEDDKNMYCYTMPGSGYVQFKVRNLGFDKARKEGWKTTLYDSTMTKIDFFDTDDLTETSYSFRYNFKKGTLIYVEIRNKYSTSKGIDYEITPIFTSTTSWEAENNDGLDRSTYLAMGKARCGTIYKNEDQDYYVFTPKKRGKVKCSLSLATAIREKNDTGQGMTDYFYFEVLDSKGETIDSRIFQAKNTSITIDVKPYKKYYLHIYSSNLSALDAMYKVRVAYKK